MNLGSALGRGIERTEPQTQYLGSSLIAFVDRRSAAVCKESVNTGTGFQTPEPFSSGDDQEFPGLHARRRPETRPRMFAAPPAMAVRDRSQKSTADFVT